MPNVSLVDGHIDEPKTTNYDRIRNMSLEQLANSEYVQSALCNYIQTEHHKLCVAHETCDNCILEFLKSEATDNDR